MDRYNQIIFYLNQNILTIIGPRVVSRLLTTEHLQRVTAVLKRKPTIWDNLHANDYDPKRIFMGPFLGRSVAIRSETAGLLLNPNCKYEANYIPVSF
jgi:protein O-GlcNAcase / histone acetyltransferase